MWNLSHRLMWGPPDFNGNSFLPKSLCMTSWITMIWTTAVSANQCILPELAMVCMQKKKKRSLGQILESSKPRILNGRYFRNYLYLMHQIATWTGIDECKVEVSVERLDVQIAVFAKWVYSNDYFEHPYFTVHS